MAVCVTVPRGSLDGSAVEVAQGLTVQGGLSYDSKSFLNESSRAAPGHEGMQKLHLSVWKTWGRSDI
jgi:hypothetical protein